MTARTLTVCPWFGLKCPFHMCGGMIVSPALPGPLRPTRQSIAAPYAQTPERLQ